MNRFTFLCGLLLLVVVSAHRHHEKHGKDHVCKNKCKFMDSNGKFYSLKKLAKKEPAFHYSDETSGANVTLSFCRALPQSESAACDAATSVCLELNGGTFVSAGRFPNVTLAALPASLLDIHPVAASNKDDDEHDDDDDEDDRRRPEKDDRDDDDEDDDDKREHKRPERDGRRKHHRRPEKDRREDGRREHRGRKHDGRGDRKPDGDTDGDKRKRKPRAEDDGAVESDKSNGRGLQVVYANGDVCPSDNQTLMSTIIELHCAHNKKLKVTAFRLAPCVVHITAESRAACPRRPRHHRSSHDDDDFDDFALPFVIGASVCVFMTVAIIAVLVARRRRRQLQASSSSEVPLLTGAVRAYPAVAYERVVMEPQTSAPVQQPTAPLYPELVVPSQGVPFGVQQYGGQPFVYPAFFAPHPYMIQQAPAGPRSVNNDESLI